MAGEKHASVPEGPLGGRDWWAGSDPRRTTFPHLLIIPQMLTPAARTPKESLSVWVITAFVSPPPPPPGVPTLCLPHPPRSFPVGKSSGRSPGRGAAGVPHS